LNYLDIAVTIFINSLGIAAVSMSTSPPAENIKRHKPSADNIVDGNATMCHPTIPLTKILYTEMTPVIYQ
jgi:hypothetical protein